MERQRRIRESTTASRWEFRYVDFRVAVTKNDQTLIMAISLIHGQKYLHLPGKKHIFQLFSVRMRQEGDDGRL